MPLAKILIPIFLFPVFLLLGIYFYSLYKYPSDKELSQTIKPARQLYPEDLITRMGARLCAFPKTRHDNFLNFPASKPQGAIRIGAFGDSHTFGDEVEAEAGWPSQLQRLLSRRFPEKKIEVLNFGMKGHGFQEQFFLYERYAEAYGIDYVLYGPWGLQETRDLTFRKIWFYSRPALDFPKNRFVLSGGEKEVKEISLPGQSPEEKYKSYYTLLPSLRALRFDKKPFQLWESLFPWLRGRLKNPFYYSTLPARKEASKINQILLKKILAARGRKILFFSNNKGYFQDYQKTGSLYNLSFFESKMYKSFLYRVFWHPSSFGNEIAAHAFLNGLSGRAAFNLNIFACHWQKFNFPPSKKPPDLEKAGAIFIGSKNRVFGELRLNSPEHYHKNNQKGEISSRLQGAKSLIGFSSRRADGLGEGPIFPLPFALSRKSRVEIKFSGGETAFLGRPEALDDLGGVFNFYSDYIWWISKEDRHTLFFLPANVSPAGAKAKIEKNKGRRAWLPVDGFAIGELELEARLRKGKLQAVYVLNLGKKASFAMMGPQSMLSESRMPGSFPLYFHYDMGGGRILKSRIPEWSCRREKRPYQLSLTNFEPITPP